jgi:hypothetical protein
MTSESVQISSFLLKKGLVRRFLRPTNCRNFSVYSPRVQELGLIINCADSSVVRWET